MAKPRKTTRPPQRTEDAAPRAQPAAATPGMQDRIVEWVKSIGLTILIYLFLRIFLIESFTIISGSMERTLLIGDYLLLSKAAYGAKVPWTPIRLPGYEEPSRREIVVFRWAHQPGVDVIKRIVGVPGDTLSMRAAVLSINGKPQQEPYAQGRPDAEDVRHPWMAWQREHVVGNVDRAKYDPSLHNWGPVVVPAGKYFLMGDNRDDSLDSRYWGFVDHNWVKGRALVLYFSYNAASYEPFPWIREVRWKRVGKPLR